MLRKVEFLAVLLAVTAASALADADDPPSRVARLNYQSGSVSFRPGSVDEWAAATLNYPLTTGDHLWTDAGSQAEMHVGSTAIRMGQQTALSFLNLDDRTVQLSVTQGSVSVRIVSLAEDEIFEIDTPNSAVTLRQAGEYRIDADGDRSVTVVSVRRGNAEVSAGASTFPLYRAESATITGMDNVSQEVGAAPPRDEFDEWCIARDRREQEIQSARYVSPEMTGYEDLDANGTWREEPDYGWVWAPRVEIGWAPYRYGHWAWVEPWGWTWIDDAPWGFAPFHYGRWALVAGGWVWVPGTRVVRPVYAPALVVFVGGGFGGGGVAAWFPLGPREVYRPAYHVSEVYVRQVNVTHVTNINVVNVTNVRYVNQGVPGAVTAVSHETFVSARPVARSLVRVDAREVAQAQVANTAPIAPRRESVLAGAPRASAPPARFAERPVVARTPPPEAPVSFRAKQQALEANQGRPLDVGQLNNVRGNAPAPRPIVRTLPPAPVTNAPRPAPDFRRGEPRSDRPAFQPQPQPQPQAPPPSPRRFEEPRAERPRPVEQQPAVQPPPSSRRIEEPRPQAVQPAPPPSPRRVEAPPPETRREAAPEPRSQRKVERPEKKEDKKQN